MEQNMPINVSCCIAGGGPAGMMAGFLLARAGVDVLVLEKHADFFRDFRGDNIHPSTLQVMHELGILEEFLKVPHQEVRELKGWFNDTEFVVANFSHLKIATPFIGLMPQWDFLNFIASQASAYKNFHLKMNAEVTDLLWDNGRVVGVKVKTGEGITEVHASLVIGTDGRKSTVRRKAELKVLKTGAPIDVLWFRISKNTNDPSQTFGRFYQGAIMVLLERGNYWQCAYVIEKGSLDTIKQKGIEALRENVAKVVPFFSNRLEELKNWDDIKLLSVDIDRLEKWYCDGLLCIGDAAHAMSPIGGVGINLAIQDAVAAANMLYAPLLKKSTVTTSMLAKVQQRRELPMRVIQKMQVTIQKGMVYRRQNLQNTKLPVAFRLLKAIPLLRRIPAWLIGMGIRPEHVKAPDYFKKSSTNL